jgi:hypothetical protein
MRAQEAMRQREESYAAREEERARLHKQRQVTATICSALKEGPGVLAAGDRDQVFALTRAVWAHGPDDERVRGWRLAESWSKEDRGRHVRLIAPGDPIPEDAQHVDELADVIAMHAESYEGARAHSRAVAAHREARQALFDEAASRGEAPSEADLRALQKSEPPSDPGKWRMKEPITTTELLAVADFVLAPLMGENDDARLGLTIEQRDFVKRLIETNDLVGQQTHWIGRYRIPSPLNAEQRRVAERKKGLPPGSLGATTFVYRMVAWTPGEQRPDSQPGVIAKSVDEIVGGKLRHAVQLRRKFGAMWPEAARHYLNGGPRDLWSVAFLALPEQRPDYGALQIRQRRKG